MLSYRELVERFYAECPDARGIVSFYRQNLDGGIALSSCEKIVDWNNVVIRQGQGISVFTNGRPRFSNALLGVFNQVGNCRLGPVEQSVIFHHETYHAIQKLRGCDPLDDLEIHKEECEADAYATLRTLADYGEDAIPFIRVLADWRMVHWESTKHLTTFSIDKAIDLYCAMQETLMLAYKPAMSDYVGMAKKIAEKDPFQQSLAVNANNEDNFSWLTLRHELAHNNYATLNRMPRNII
jgi:hypothetical protein